MSSSLHFILLSLVYVMPLTIIFIKKAHIDTIEIKSFGKLLFLNIIGLILELCCILFAINLDSNSAATLLANKFYLIYLVAFVLLFSDYIILISIGDEKYQQKIKKIKFVSHVTFFLSIIAIFILKVNIYTGKSIYSDGPAIAYVYIVSIIAICISLSLMFKNYKKTVAKKYLPLIIFVVGLGIASVMQKINPSVTLITTLESVVLFVMYFTIENPDVMMIEQLNIARDQADKANQAKSDFLSSMSHEIRTPLNAIVGFSQALQEEDLPESAHEEVKDIVRASESLLELVNGILDISKIEADKIEIVDGEYNIYDILEDLVALTKARMGDKKLEFKTYFDQSIPQVLYGDATRIKQVILNLLTNSVKYTKEGEIVFRVSSIQNNGVCRLIVSVEDTGIGIKKESIDKLFTKFQRLDLEKNKTIEGTGLGLAITKKLVELMNGRIMVQSIYGKGSKFTVSLDQKIVAQVAEKKKEQETATDAIDFSNKKILIVDDNKLNLKVASRLLEKYKCEVITVESGFECLDKVNTEKFDLILMDDMMPDMGGIETLHKLKEKPDYNIPTIALTANAISGMREKYINEGFDDYLSKPIDKIELDKILKSYLK